jgi:hypothetical protein
MLRNTYRTLFRHLNFSSETIHRIQFSYCLQGCNKLEFKGNKFNELQLL